MRPAIAPPEPLLEPRLVSIIGAGPFARAIARIAARSGATLRVFSRSIADRPELAQGLEGAELTSDLAYAVKQASVIVFAVPAGELDDIATRLGPHVLPDQIALLASRGITEGFVLPHQHVRRETCLRKLGVLGGPLNIGELEAGRRLNVVVATRFDEVLAATRTLTESVRVSFAPSRDLVGVSIAGAVANVAGIAAGLAEALGMGGTARGVLVARGIFEARILAVEEGADPGTFAGLAGLGELIPRDVRSMERHEELGRALAERSLEAALEQATGHVEGVTTTFVAAERGRARGLSLPLIEGLVAIMRGEVSPRDELDAILAEPLNP